MKKTTAINLLLFLAFNFVSTTAFTDGLITIQGKVTSIAETDYVIETPKSVYYVRRSKVKPAEAAKITKVEAQVSLTVPFSAIDVVKPKPAGS
jgi:hypothetical protein